MGKTVIIKGTKPFDYKDDARDYAIEMLKKNAVYLPARKNKIWLVKDGSVDTEKLDLLGINYIVYRDTKPTIIEY